MYCTNCGKEINDGVSFCPNCGQAVGGNQKAPHVEPSQYQYNYESPQVQYNNCEPVKKGPDGYAIASLVLGIMGFFILPIVGGILAIVFGNMSVRENGPNTMARVGKILGIIALAIMVVCIVIVIACIALVGVGTVSDVYYNM